MPKMAIRFSSFELYKGWLCDAATGRVSTAGTFVAELGAGVTESVLVMSPMKVIKIRLQAQRHSLADPLDMPKYRNAVHAAFTIVREEGLGALHKGVSLTAARQGKCRSACCTARDHASSSPCLSFSDQPGREPRAVPRDEARADQAAGRATRHQQADACA